MSLKIDGYTIQKKLGTGGMSTVYLAIQESLGRPCALKVMSSALTKGDSFTHRFKLEGKTIAKLEHYNIVHIYDIETNDDCCYIAMEYLAGGTLYDRLHDDLSLQEVLHVIKQVARALGFAHQHDIIHRDIKPANIMFRRDGTAVLTDYGIAKHLSEETAALTGTGSLIGTPAYMSPEQIQVGTLTGRSDLYSLGVVFYETLIGVQPYVASNPIAVAFMHVNQPIPTLPEPIGFLQDLLRKVLAKDPAQRFQNAAELISAIEKIEREHDTERIMLLHRRNDQPAQASQPTEEQKSLLSQYPDTKLITVLDDGQKPPQRPPPLPSPTARKAKKWAALAALIGVMALGVIGYRGYRVEQQELEYTKLLEVAARQIEQQRFIAPERDNLYSTLTALNALAASDPRARAATTVFVDKIMIEARREQAHGTFDASLALIDKGLQFADDDVGLKDLRKQVEAQNRRRQKELRQQQQEQAVERLLALARAQIDADQLLAPDGDNAVNSLRQVLALAPDQKQALASLDIIAERFAKRATQALAANDEDLTREIIDQGLAISASHPQLLKQQDVLRQRAAQRERAQQANLAREKKIEELLAEAKTQLQQGRLISPAEANAASSYEQVLQLDKDNKQARDGLSNLTLALSKRARSSLEAGELAAGLADIEAALALAPNDKALLQLQQQIVTRQQKIARAERERQDKIQRLLQLAQRQIGERKLNIPANNNAVHSLQQILALEPDHPQARAGLQQVADVYENLAREQLARDSDNRSNSFATAGLRVIPEHNGLLAVQRELLERKREKKRRENVAREERGQQLNKLLETAAEQFAAQKFTTPDTDNAYATWRAVLTLQPDNRAAQQAISQLPGKILQQAKADVGAGDWQRSQQVLQQGLQVWPDHPGLRELEQQVLQDKSQRQRAADIAALIRQAEQQRRAGNVFSPAKNNAVARLQQALALDNDNADATAALKSIVDEWLGNARRALEREQFAQTEAFIGEVKTLRPEHPQVKAVEDQLAVGRTIKSLMDQAKALAAQNLFTLPQQDNAFMNYRKVLKLNPVHKQASDALTQLPQRIFRGAQDALQAQDWQLCSSLIEQGLLLLPGDKRLLALNSDMLGAQTRIAQQREEQDLSQRINRLLTVARNQKSRRQLSAPPGDNAVATLEQILALDPGNSAALQLKVDIANVYTVLTEEALQSGDEQRALLLLARGLQVNPENTRLKAQKKELDEKIQQREAEQLATEQLEEERLTGKQQKEAGRLASEQQQNTDHLTATQPQTKQGDAGKEKQTGAAEETQQNQTGRLAALIKQAEQQREDKQLIAPAGANALQSYRQALQVDPQSNAAKQGIKAIKSYYRDQVKAHRAARNIPMAAAWVEAIRAEFPADTALKTLQQGFLQRGYRDTLHDGRRGPTLVYVPAGTFTMGDRSGKGFANEKPAHEESVPRGFMLGRLEVSFDEFDRFVRANGVASPADQGWGRGHQPIINVDWQTARQYLAWLSEQSGQPYRLPSEIEWEYAARAGTGSDYWWGERIGTNQANCEGCGSQYGSKRPMAVGSFKANPLGLFDTAGNVHEWVSSPYGNSYPSDGGTLTGPGSNAVARGGSWYDAPKFSRASMRVLLKPRFKSFFVGFRVLRALPAPAPAEKK